MPTKQSVSIPGGFMRLGIRPTVDVVFKKVFGSSAHTAVTVSLLNSILPLVGLPRVGSVDIINPYSLASYVNGKESILDIRALDESGRDFQIEIQMRQVEAANHRMTDNVCRLYSEQIKKGEEYRDHRPVVSVWIFNEPLFPEGSWLDTVRLVRDSSRRTSDEVFDTHIAIVILELGLWKKLAAAGEDLPAKTLRDNATGSTFEEEGLGKLTQWMRFLASGEELDPEAMPEWANEETVREAVEIMRVFTKEEEERDVYRCQVEAERLANSIRGEATRKGLAEGRAQGLTQGLAQGLEQGLSQGLEKGLEQGKIEGKQLAALENAHRMKALGIPLSTIIAVTGISGEEFERFE